ncbi:Hsp20/alpha crystallin family protein [Inquilinus limosus]|uniref:Hsp20/alpha crystallin family protein n=1 Tax=Inquilinus limosus TaxID=171674 RepID=UPI003F176BB6
MMRDLIPWGRGGRSAMPYREDESPLLSLHREMNRLFDEAFRGFDAPSLFGRTAWPNLEVTENDKAVTVCAEIPGLTEKDVEVTLAEGILSIRGEKKSEVEDKERHFSERSYGRFERQIAIGREVDEDKVEATFRNGVLTVTLPKTAPAQSKMRRITVSGEKKAGEKKAGEKKAA